MNAYIGLIFKDEGGFGDAKLLGVTAPAISEAPVRQEIRLRTAGRMFGLIVNCEVVKPEPQACAHCGQVKP